MQKAAPQLSTRRRAETVLHLAAATQPFAMFQEERNYRRQDWGVDG